MRRHRLTSNAPFNFIGTGSCTLLFGLLSFNLIGMSNARSLTGATLGNNRSKAAWPVLLGQSADTDKCRQAGKFFSLTGRQDPYALRRRRSEDSSHMYVGMVVSTVSSSRVSALVGSNVVSVLPQLSQPSRNATISDDICFLKSDFSLSLPPDSAVIWRNKSA